MLREMTSLPLQDMIARVVNDASQRQQKLAEDNSKKVQDLVTYERREHGHVPSVKEEKAEKEKCKTAGYQPKVAPDFVEKLASAVDYIAQRTDAIVPAERGVIESTISKLAGGMGVPPAVNVPGSVLKTTQAIGGEQKYTKDKPKTEDAAASEAGTKMHNAGMPGGSTQVANNMNDAPGGGGKKPTGEYPASGVLQHLKKHGSASEFYAAALALNAQQEKQAFVGVDDLVGLPIGMLAGKGQQRAGEPYSFGGQQALSLLLPGGVGYQVGRGIAHHTNPAMGGNIPTGHPSAPVPAKTEKSHSSGKTEKTAASAALQLILSKFAGEDVFPANISAARDASPLSGGGVMKNYASGEMPPTGSMPGHSESGAGNQARSLLESNDKAQHATKGEAKAPVKAELGKVLDEPALNSKTDTKLRENLRNSDKAGVKIAEAQAAIFQQLQKVAAGGCTCGSQGTCSYCRLQEARKTLRSTATEKTANMMGAGMSGGAAPPPNPTGGGMPPGKMGGNPPPDCQCGGQGKCEPCMRQQLTELLMQQKAQQGGGAPGGEKGEGMMGQMSGGMSPGMGM